jgi:hypothetical protein
MPLTARTRGRHPLVALLTVLALVASACNREPADPGEALAEAFERTFGSSVAYQVTIDADREAIDGLGDDVGRLATLIAGFSMDGVLDEDVASGRLEGLGSTLVEIRSFGEELTYARLGISDLLALAGIPDPAALVDAAELDVDPEVTAALQAALRGEWIAIEGPLHGSDDVDEDAAEATLRELLGGDKAAFFERYVVVDSREEVEGGEVYRVGLELRELVRSVGEANERLGEDAPADLDADLADLPERVDGTVEVRDGVVTDLRFALGDALRDAGGELTGAIDLVIELSDHGEAGPVEEPDAAATITAEQLDQGMAALSEADVPGLP